MAENDNPNPAPNSNDPAQPPAGEASATQTPPPNSPPSADPVKMAEELGRLKKVEEDYNSYIQKVDPVLQTIFSDEGLSKQVTDKHNKRIGITPTDSTPDPNQPDTTPPPSATEVDNRNTLLNRTIKEFYGGKKIDVNTDEGKEMDKKVGKDLKEMLDPMGNKSMDQVMRDVSLVKLPDFLENAYFLANKEQIEKQAEERGRQALQQESVGIMGSFSSSSTESQDNVTLTLKEREVAAKQGISEEKYLENKKKLMAQRPSY